MLLLMRNQLAITAMGGRVALFAAALSLSSFGSVGFLSLQAQNAPAFPVPVAPSPSVTTAQNPVSKAAAEMTSAMEGLKSDGKLTSNRAVSAAVRKVINQNSTQHEIQAPMGAKVIAVHKYPGDLVRVGDKIVTLELNGKKIPILAKQDGIMQTINVSKGGVIGNSRPRAAKYAPQQGTIRLVLRNI